MNASEEPTTPLVLLVTCAAWPGGEPGHGALDAALEARGLTGRWVVWDDLGVDWGAADVIAVRSTWDYDARLGEFLGWASGVGPGLLNGVDVFRWNTDKRYLVELARAGLPVVPTVVADTVFDVRAAADRFGLAVVKPRVGDSRWSPTAASGCPDPKATPAPGWSSRWSSRSTTTARRRCS